MGKCKCKGEKGSCSCNKIPTWQSNTSDPQVEPDKVTYQVSEKDGEH